MVPMAPKNIGKLYLILGTNEIKLSDFTREANERWLRITNQDTWSSTLSRVRIARQEAIEYGAVGMSHFDLDIILQKLYLFHF